MSLMPAYFTTTKTSKHKSNNKANTKAQAEHDAWLRSLGIKDKPTKRTSTKWSPPRLSTEKRVTSDTIPANGNKKKNNKYTGNEIAGVALSHKQNYEPIRKDNMTAAIDSATMRRS
jgi:hypothetical protein